MPKDNVADDLRAELKTLADTLEEVLNSSTDKSKEEIGKLRSKAESALKESRVRLGETSDAIVRQTRETAARADEYVRENPWTGVGIGAAVGLVLGVLLTRRYLWRILNTRRGRDRAFSVSASGSLRCWLKWSKRACAWWSWSWKKRRRTSSSCF